MHVLYDNEWDDKVIKYGDGIGIWKEVVVVYFGLVWRDSGKPNYDSQ